MLRNFDALVQTVARLRAPDGCPWDREQTHGSIASHITEEAAETVDAIERNDLIDMREELGDLLLQVVLQSQIASEAGEFELADVIKGINDKLIRRHPHVFGNEVAFAAAKLTTEQRRLIEAAQDPNSVITLWDSIKLVERQQKAEEKAAARAADASLPFGDHENPGLLDSVPTSLPALMQAQYISRKAVSAGFEWESLDAVWDQVYSELEEFRLAKEDAASQIDDGAVRGNIAAQTNHHAALQDAAAQDTAAQGAAAKDTAVQSTTPKTSQPTQQAAHHVAEEFGDVLFSLCNVARKENIDAESALRLSCRKFRQRWAIMERYAEEEGSTLEDFPVEKLEQLWVQAKKEIQVNDLF
ncbi:MAG: MazG family protein [Coriobacteriales bacterium]|nr:MazG family protein [Coriobacteriales bacterium]